MENRETRMDNKQKNFRNLEVWQKALELADNIYEVCAKFPKHELYALAAQMTRAAVSVPSNIAEGHERNTTSEFIQFLGYARGSLAELETQIIIAAKRKYINELELAKLEKQSDSVTKMLWKLITVLSNKTKNKSRFSNPVSPISEAKPL